MRIFFVHKPLYFLEKKEKRKKSREKEKGKRRKGK